MEASPTADVNAKSKSSKRKREEELAELEVDINAAEPPSKKALRKAKKAKTVPATESKSTSTSIDVAASKVDTSANSHPTKDTTSDQSTNPNHTRSPHGIWIGNLSFTTTKDDLTTFLTGNKEHVIHKSQITRVHLPPGRKSPAGKPQNKGFAYIDFDSAETLATALELSESLVGGRRVLIKDATSFEGRPAANKDEIASGKPPSKRVFVGNLSFDTSSEALEDHFGVCGTIVKTQVATFEDSGKCKGYAWIEFENVGAATAAVRGWIEKGEKRTWLKKIDGRPLRMEFAEDATTRYNKRYGRDAKKIGNGEQEQVEAIEEVNETIAEKDGQRQGGKPRTKEAGKSAKVHTRKGYEEDTVRKLTGGIVESEGKKVTFD